MWGFEDNDISKPVVLGHLAKSEITSTAFDLRLKSLITEINAQLPADTTIGNVSPKDLENLTHTSGNIQRQINLLKDEINAIEIQVPRCRPTSTN